MKYFLLLLTCATLSINAYSSDYNNNKDNMDNKKRTKSQNEKYDENNMGEKEYQKPQLPKTEYLDNKEQEHQTKAPSPKYKKESTARESAANE